MCIVYSFLALGEHSLFSPGERGAGGLLLYFLVRGDGHELKPGHVGRVKILFYPLFGVSKSNLRISWGIGVVGCIF